MITTYSEPRSLRTIFEKRPEPEPTFADAQRWWKPMRQAVTFPGVPGYPWQPSVLWNTALQFWPVPGAFSPDAIKHSMNIGMAQELAGHEADALQIDFSFGPYFEMPDRWNSDARKITQWLEEGRMPIIGSRLRQGGLEWTCRVFCRLAHGGLEARHGNEVLLTEVHWIVRNPSGRTRAATLHAHLASPHTRLGYKVAMQKAMPYQRGLRFADSLVVDDCGRARLGAVTGEEGTLAWQGALTADVLEKSRTDLAAAGLTRDVMTFTANVPAGKTVAARWLVPYFPSAPELLKAALRVSSGAALRTARGYWRRKFSESGRIHTPEPILNDCFDAYLYQAMLATGYKPRSGHWILKTSPNNYEGLWGAHASIGAFSMDLRGQHRWARKVYDTFLANQGPVPISMVKTFPGRTSEGYSAHPGFIGNIEGHMAILWAFYHGWTLWAIGRHVRLCEDWQWFRKQASRLDLACEWITEQRRRTMKKDGRGRKALGWGLLPAGNAFDWGFGHMFWSDAHTYRGFKEIADLLREIRHPHAGKWLAEAEDYRQDIIVAVTRCRDRAEPVPLADGTTIPYVPMAPEMLDFYSTDWTYVSCGPLNLAWAGVVPPDHELVEQVLAYLNAGRPRGKWMAQQKKYQGWDWGAMAKADEEFLECTRPRKGRAFLWRHKMCYEPGWIPQSFTFMYRDDLPDLLEHFYSLTSNGGQYVHLRGPVEQRDGVAWCQPGQASLLWLLRDMLVREEGEELWLCGSCPRRWMADGQSVAITDLPTHFGKASYRFVSRVKQGVIRGQIDLQLRRSPRRIRLRLRHPQGRIPVRVRVNGRPVCTEGDWIELPQASKMAVEAQY